MNLAQANLEDILNRYYEATAAHGAARRLCELIDRKQERELARLLRDYRQIPISDADEINFRAAVDRLLTCYSVLEIASIANFISSIPNEFASEALTILSDHHVRRYYEELYAMRLSTLFRRRLAGQGVMPADADRVSDNRAMMAFLELDRQFQQNLEDKTLLRMLDSFTIENQRFRNLVELIETPQRFMDHLLQNAETNKILALAANELGLFMQFCFDLQELLVRTANNPILQSALWTHYGYWFDIFGDELRARLDEALEHFLAWRASDEVAGQATGEIQEYVRRGRTVLGDLTSGQLGAVVHDLI